jgi:small-conductance mechanosensitive channel
MPLSYKFKQLYFGMRDALTSARHYEQEETKMKNTLSRKAAYIGAGAGLVFFAIFGLLPGSLLGGAAGIKLAGLLFSLPLEPGIVSRMIVLASMLVGVVVSGITIVTATSTTGWLLGRVIDASGHQLDPDSAVMSKIK